jgi:peptidyl-prolyl cis-trans isomerase C
MKKYLLLVAALVISVPAQAGNLLEAVVARVGDRIITRSQFEHRLNAGLQEIERTALPSEIAPAQAKFRSELLNEMLSELLIKDRADRLNISVSPAEITDALNRLKSQYGFSSDEEFQQSLERSGLSRSEMESRLRDSLLTNKVFARELRSRADLSDRELRLRYDREKEQYRRPERARVREIIVIPEDWTRPVTVEEARQKAAAAAEKGRQGGDFAALAREVSDSPSKEAGGDLGVLARGELITLLDQAVFAAPAGTIVGPIETRSGFHVLRVEERLPSEVPGFDEVKDQLRKDASEETFQRDYKAYIERLRKEAFLQVNENNLPRS